MLRVFATEAEVLALSPDAASSKAAKGLQSIRKWPSSGCDDQAVWGECQGSGSTPYQTQVDLSGPTFKCSCPSRKFPCKHGLALLLLRAQGLIAEGAPQPAWVTQWLNQRQEKAQKKAAQAAQTATPVAPQTGQEEKSTPSASAVAAQRRVAKRWDNTESGLQELALWMQDMVTHGLATVGSDSVTHQRWNTMKARMIDAQAPGMAARVEQAWQCVDSGPQWQNAVLRQLGHWQLVIDAVRRREQLAPEVLADVQAALGWPLDKATVIAQSSAQVDTWFVIGQRLIEREGRLLERHVWLQGNETGHTAWLLDYTQGGRGFDSAWLVGQGYRGALHFYRGASPVRAVAVDMQWCTAQMPCQAPAFMTPEPCGVAPCLHDLQQRIARNPLGMTQPFWCPDTHLLSTSGGQWCMAWPDQGTHSAHTARVPVTIDDADAWQLLALGGGIPLTLFGAWEQGRWHILSAWTRTPASPTTPQTLQLVWSHEAVLP